MSYKPPNCPKCGAFMAASSHIHGWQCMARYCGWIVSKPAEPKPGPDWNNPGIGRALAFLEDDK
jgi:ribosomal protein S27AE